MSWAGPHDGDSVHRVVISGKGWSAVIIATLRLYAYRTEALGKRATACTSLEDVQVICLNSPEGA
jgi:hypothetical protein